jgi:hypothetical protein
LKDRVEVREKASTFSIAPDGSAEAARFICLSAFGNFAFFSEQAQGFTVPLSETNI